MKQYDICLINLDSTISTEIRKTRNCLIISPDEMNDVISTVVIAPLTFHSPPYPTRVPLTFQGKSGYIVLDQVRTIDQARVVKKLGKIGTHTANKVKSVLFEMLVQ
jgi:mRNA interferase MazF